MSSLLNETVFLGYVRNNQPDRAIGLLNKIKNPDEVMLIIFFNACAHLPSQETLKLVKRVSKEMPKSFYSNPRLLTSLFDAFVKCGDCSSAETVYFKMTKSVESYGNLISGFNKENNPVKGFNLFKEMKKNGIEGNVIIYLCVIEALSRFGDYELSKAIIEEMPNAFLSDNRIQTMLIDLWVSWKTLQLSPFHKSLVLG